MNNQIRRSFINAILADASYVELHDNTGVLLEDVIQKELSKRLTQPIAEFITQNFQVKTQTGTTEIDGGFSATVWQGKAGTEYDGQTYVSMRGTAQGSDFLDDGQLSLTGIAYNQIADMVNWWLRATTPSNLLAKQIDVSGYGSFPRHFVATESVNGTGELADVSQITSINGHSLGGYLATVFERLFGQAWPTVYGVSTFNSAGFNDLQYLNINYELNTIRDLMGPDLGFSSFLVDAQLNFFAENGYEVTTNTWRPIGFEQIGIRIPLYQEDSVRAENPVGADPFNNHYMYKVTDLLALGNVFAKLDSQFGVEQLNQLVKSASEQMDESYEKLLDGLRRLLLGASVEDTPIGDTSDASEGSSRSIYHQNLADLMSSDVFRTLVDPSNPVAIEITAPATSVDQARTDFGDFLSLYYLSPFTLHSDDPRLESIFGGANGGLYTDWLQDAALTDAQRASGLAYFSDQWLADRAQLLSHLLQRNLDDTVYASSISADQIFEDYATPGEFDGTHLILTGPATLGENSRQIIFGDDRANQLQGGNQTDHLYGGAGGDLLTGGKGNDYLEGGGGSDIYAFIAGDGMDTILDSDGSGKITLNGIQAQGSASTTASHWFKRGDATWQDDDHDVRYHLQTNEDATQTLYLLKNGDVVKVQNWHAGDLGITLGNGAGPGAVDHTFLGDQRASMIGVEIDQQVLPDDPSYTHFKWSVVSWNSDGTLKFGVAETDFDDVITGTINKDRMAGLGGNDALDGGRGDDQLEGGTGNDLLGGGAGSDTIHGGIGNDIILTATGLAAVQRVNPTDNWLSFYDLPVSTVAWTQGRTWGMAINSDGTLTLYGGGSLALDSVADTAYGDAGDDMVIGGLGGDYLDGGADNDYAWGQAGNDLIAGGTGDDNLWGDGILAPGFYQTAPASQHGNDLLDGADGADRLYGGGKNDVLLGGTENDYLWGDDKSDEELPGQYHGDDYLDGGTGDDILFGGGADDTLLGGSGGDTLYGDDATDNLALSYHGDDILHGGSGVDTLYGMGGNDTLDGGDGNDTLYGGDDNDLLTGGNGDDDLYGGHGADTYIVNAGVDTIVDPDKNSKIVFGAGIDSDSIKLHLGSLMLDLGNGNAVHIEGFDQNDVFNSVGVSQFQFADGTVLSSAQLLARGFDLDGTTQDDTITGTNTTDRMRGLAGNDTLIGGAGDDTLAGGTGADRLEGGAGDDVYLNVSGEDVIRDMSGQNTIRLATATDLGAGGATLATYGDQNQYLRADIALNSGETLKIENAFFGTEALLVFTNDSQLDLETLIGTRLNTALNLQAGDGGGKIYGGAGNDRIFGGSGNDIISGANGSDFLLGGAGDDSYLLGADSGSDRIVDILGDNIIRFAAGVAVADLNVKSSAAGLVLYVGGKENATITLGAESFRFVFADGQSMTFNELLLDSRRNALSVNGDSGSNTLYGSLAADSLNGGDGNDSLWGGRGNDRLSGGAGSDDYHYRIGDGLDVIDEQGDSASDQVIFGEGIQLEDVAFNHRANGDLTLDVAGLDHAVTVRDWYNASEQRVEHFVFADGRSVTAATLVGMDVTPQRGGDGDDRLTGTAYRDVIQGGVGNDSLYGMAGNDELYGDTGEDVLDGAAGSDQLSGGRGADHYRLSMASGIDQVIELAAESSIIDVADYDVSRLTGSRVGDDLWLGVRGTQDGLLLREFYTLAHHWQVRGEDGALSDLTTLLADNAARRAELGEAAALAEDFYDRLHDNVLHAYKTQGFERQADGSWQTPLQITASRQVNSYVRADGYSGFMPGGSTKYHLHGDFGFVSSRLSRADFSANDASIAIADDSPYLYGDANVQIRWSEPESSETTETSYSYFGHYLYTVSEAIEIRASLGIGSLPNPYVYAESANYNHTQTVTAVSGTKVSSSAADGSGVNLAATSAQTFFNLSPLPTTLKVSVTTLNTAIHSINGGDGDNVIRFDGQFAIVNAGDGNDTINAHSYDFILGSSSEGILKGTALLNGGAGDDLIVAGYNGDSLIGGAGNDMLRGEHGDDRYYLLRDDSGTDTIYDASYGGDLEQDGVVFGEGISRGDLSYSWGVESLPGYTYGSYDESRVRLFQTLDIRCQTDSVVRLVTSTPFVNSYGDVVERNDWEQTGIEYLEFADGVRVWLAELIGSSQVPLRPDLNRASTVSKGTANEDTLLGSSSEDDLYGSAGDDELFGQAGGDWLIGGAGSDLLAGGSGGDRYYVFQDDSGLDLLYDFSGSGSDLGYGGTDIGYGGAVDSDTVVFGWGIEASDLAFSWDSVSLSPDNDGQFFQFQTLTLRWRPEAGIRLVMPRIDDSGGPSAGVEFFRFADGSQLTMAQLLTLAPPSPEHAPELNAPIDDQLATEDIEFAFTLPEDTFVDSDPGEALQYGYWFESDSDWLSFDPATRTLHGTPDTGAVGVSGVWMTATDRFGASATTYFEIGVAPINTVAGSAGDDVLLGTSGSDKLVGFTGSDILVGGEGDDLFIVDGSDTDYDSFEGGGGFDVIRGGGSDDIIRVHDLAGGDSIEKIDGGAGINTVAGSALDDRIDLLGTQLMGIAAIEGGEGDDTLIGSLGDDVLVGGVGNDRLSGSSGRDMFVFSKGDGLDEIIDDGLDGGPRDIVCFNDVASGEVRSISQIGGNHDLLLVYGEGDQIIVDNYLGANADSSIAEFQFSNSVSWRRMDILQRLIDANAAPIIVSSALNAVKSDGITVNYSGSMAFIDPNVHDNHVSTPGNATGTAGGNLVTSITEIEGAGSGQVNWNYRYSLPTAFGSRVQSKVDQFTVGIDDGLGGVAGQTVNITVTTGSSVANTFNGGDGIDILLGAGGNDVLNGEAGNDLLDGGAGADSMAGGLGDDTYLVDKATDFVSENVGEGIDQIVSRVSYLLSDNVENLILNNTTAIKGTGNGADNVIVGGSGNNIIDGLAGADTLIGGLGNDTYVVDNTGDLIVEMEGEGRDLVRSWISFELSMIANVENLTLLGSDNLNAIGDAGDNVITGNSGDNVLIGGVGADKLIGGGGNDTYLVNITVLGNLEDTITAGAGIDTVRLQASYAGATKILAAAAAIENYDISATGASLLSLTGNASNNVLTGNDANNLINGGAGADVMAGGQGNDVYTVENSADLVVEAVGEGDDMIKSSLSFDLSSNGINVEQLILTGSAAANAAGNASDNLLTGNAAINNLFGNDGNDRLYGMAGNDALEGGSGHDLLVGGAGKDTLTGGTGADVFWFNTATNATANVDTITDFVSGSDSLQFSLSLLAKLGAAGQFAPGDARFRANSAGLAQDADDRLIYNSVTGELFYDANGSASGGAVLLEILAAAPNLVAGDLVVV